MTLPTLLLRLAPVSATRLLHSAPSGYELLFTNAALALSLVDENHASFPTLPAAVAPPPYHAAAGSGQPCEVLVDTWLVLSLGDGLIDIALFPHTLPTFQPPRSYLIPVGAGEALSTQLVGQPSSDGMIKLDLDQSIDPDSLDTFDGILAGWTAYKGRGPPALSGSGAAWVPAQLPSQPQGRLALVDEKTGEICGELDSDIAVHGIPVTAHHPPALLVATPQPVLVSYTPADATHPKPVAQVSPLCPESASKILVGAEVISRGILVGSDMLSEAIVKGGNAIVARTLPSTTPSKVSPATHAAVEKVLGYTQSAAKVSGKTAQFVGNISSRVGDRIGKSTGIQRGPGGEMPGGTRGYIHKGAVAFNLVFDSLEAGGKKLLSTVGNATTNVVTHSYGPEAGSVAERASQGVQNVALVYIDARGITRKAILKTAGKAAVKGRMKDGRAVVFAAAEQPAGSPQPSTGEFQGAYSSGSGGYNNNKPN